MKQKIKSLISLKTTSTFLGLLFFVLLAGGMVINAPIALAVAPTITAAEGEVGTDQVVLTFSEGVYNAISSPVSPDGDLAVADFAIVDTDNSRTISAVAHTAGASTATLTLSVVLDDTTDIGVDTIAFVATSAYNATDEAGGTGTTTINDTTAPTVTSATLHYGTGVLVVTFSEIVDAGIAVPAEFHINNVTTEDGTGVTLSAMPTDTDATTLSFTLTEAQGVAAIAISGTAGGDTVAVVLDVDTGGVTDMAGVAQSADDDNNTVTETADTTAPTVTSATLHYGTGVLVVTLSETVDASATSATSFHINNVTGTDVVTLSAAPTDTDATTLSFTLTEAQRVAAIAISGTAGGDTVAVVLDVDTGGVTDMAGVAQSADDDNNTVTETADSTAPTNQDTVFATSTSAIVGESVTIVSSGDATNNVWFAPSGTTSFSAGTTMTTAGGTATTILAPATAGSYKLFVIDSASNASSASTATLTANNPGSAAIFPVPTSTTGQAAATPANGGVISKTNTDGTSAKVILPTGALTANAVITISPTAKAEVATSMPAPSGKNIVGNYAYNFTAISGLNTAVNTFQKALTLTLTYTNEQAEGFNEGVLKIHYWNEALNQWIALEDSVVNTANNIVTATTTHFTYFAIIEGQSSEIIDGDIIQCQSLDNPFAVYIVKVVGDTKYIRHIVSLEIFNYYSHLKWENLKQVDSLDTYSLSGWARVNTGPDGASGPNDKVYEINSDQSKHWINMTAEDFLTHGGSDEAIYTVNQGELNLYTTGPDVMSF